MNNYNILKFNSKTLKCVACGQLFSLNEDSRKDVFSSINSDDYEIHKWYIGGFEVPNETIVTIYCECPGCKFIHIKVFGIGKLVRGVEANINPLSNHIKYPDFVPSSIQNDYKEAYSILHLSPRASAVLARRCLQAILRDCFNIPKNVTRLWDEMNYVKDQITPRIFQAMVAVKDIGNIGAHPEKLTESGEGFNADGIVDTLPELTVTYQEAEQLLKVIELLIKVFYVDEHDNNALIENVVKIAKEKKNNH